MNNIKSGKTRAPGLLYGGRRRPAWHGRLPAIRRRVEESRRDLYDRRALRDLLCVQESQAGSLLREIRDRKIDRAYLVSREALLAHLETIAGPNSKTTETRRIEALKTHFEEKIAGGEQIRVEVQAPVPPQASLPEGISVAALPSGPRLGQIQVAYRSAEQLLGILGQFVDLAVSNPIGLRRTIEGDIQAKENR